MKPTKRCPGCSRVLPREAFGPKGKSKANGRPYLKTLCRECEKAQLPNTEKQREYNRRWREKNTERWNAYMREWRNRHPEYREHRNKTRNLKKKCYYTDTGKLRYMPRKRWLAHEAEFGGACAYCGSIEEDLEVDHFVPISLGGESAMSNLVPACRSCNARKNSTHPKEYLSPEQYEHITAILRKSVLKTPSEYRENLRWQPEASSESVQPQRLSEGAPTKVGDATVCSHGKSTMRGQPEAVAPPPRGGQ